MEIVINSSEKRQIVDITHEIDEKLSGNGIVNIFVKHTTAALVTADLDPGTDKDILKAIENMTPDKKWNHPHDPSHFPDHLWHSLVGSNLNIPFKNGRLLLGTWQRVVLLELDGPRERKIEITTINNV